MEEKVHVEKSEKAPVVEGILENISPWHCIVTEPVDKDGFNFPFNIMKQYHKDAKLLIKRVLACLTVNLLLEQY